MSAVTPARVVDDLKQLAKIGAYKTGVHRPSLSLPHLETLEWFSAKCRDAGHNVTIDGIGNVIATSRAKGPKMLTGSHLESQNHAGWLDGPLGVVYGLEAAR